MEATDLARKTAEIASRDIGVREIPPNSNKGPRIEEYLAHVHLEPGAPYCASACSTWIAEAGHEMGLTPEFKKSGSALGIVRANPGLVIKPEEFTAEMIPCLGINEHSDHIHGHAFLIVGVDETTGQLQTIDPNSDPKGSREGGGVWALNIRSTTDAQRVCYIRIA